MHRAFALLLASIFTLLLAAGCDSGAPTTDKNGAGGDGGGTNDPTHGTVIVGVTSDLRVGVDIDRVHVVMSVAGKVTKEEDLLASTSTSTSKLEFPMELPFEDLAGGTDVAVEVSAFGVGGGTSPLTTRVASTKIVSGKKLLLRIALDSRCVETDGGKAPSCTAPKTCIAGTCAASAVEGKTLPPYSSTWTKVSNDICKPTGSGPPVLTVGEGQADYLPTMDGNEAQVESGPQGGHHIWIAIRMKGLLQSGSITTVTGHFPELNQDIGPFQVIFTFDQDEGGYCKLYGLRFQLDQTMPVDQVLGKTLEIQVKVTDKEGAIGIGKRTVVLSKQLI